jgi:hypothetical protein
MRSAASSGSGSTETDADADAKKPPEGGFFGLGRTPYLPEAAVIAAEADMAADEAASIADEAAIIDDVAAAEASAIGAVTAAGGVVVVVVVSSFLLQAAKEMAAASVTISNAVFIFLLDSGGSFRTTSGHAGNPLGRGPHRSRTRKAMAFPVPNVTL